MAGPPSAGKRPAPAASTSAPAAAPPAKRPHLSPGGSQAPRTTQGSWTNEDDELVANEIVESSQFDRSSGVELESYGVLSIKVVGCRYYNGIATVNEHALCKREPHNQYDRNAIRVDNVNHAQIGHIPRGPAAKLASLVDGFGIVLEATIAGEKGFYDMPITLELWGPSEPDAKAAARAEMDRLKLKTKKSAEQRHREELERQHKKALKEAEKERKKLAKVRLTSGGAPATYGSGQEFEVDENGEFVGSQTHGLGVGPDEWERIAGESTQFDVREVGDTVGKFGVGEENLEKMIAAKQPEKLKTQLLPYQLQGLAWLLQKEHPQLPENADDVVQLWKKKGENYQNIATHFTTDKLPELASGGILADDMGLGKTIQIISLIATDIATQKDVVPNPVIDESQCNAGSLIVAPVGVLSEWTGQMQRHIYADHQLKVFVYHGPSRTKANLSDYDVVVTTYGTLSVDHGPSGRKGIYSKKWRRVILDEAHQIRNPKARAAVAASSVQALSHWALTGTPIINSLRDLYSQLKFIRYPGGFTEWEIFNRVLMRPLTRLGSQDAASVLKVLVGTLCLRRTKDMKFVDLKLPDYETWKHAIELSPAEREKYNLLESEAKGLLNAYEKGKATSYGATKDTYRNLLEILLRMRQCCNHPNLCGERLESLIKLAGVDKVSLSPENVRALQDLLQLAIDAQEDCPVCLEPLHNPRITICKHAFGLECIERVIEGQKKCPMCRCALDSLETSTVEPAPPPDIETPPPDTSEGSSSKIDALIKILRATTARVPGRKTVVFSQWTSFFNILRPFLLDAGIGYERIDGGMPPAKRDVAIAAFANNEHCTVLLASLAVSAVGLNLTMASQVILADSWWAPAIEAQAVDRVYRLGQTKKVDVWRIVCKDTIEERVLDVQKKKMELVKQAFGDEKRRASKENRLGDIQRLLSG